MKEHSWHSRDTVEFSEFVYLSRKRLQRAKCSVFHVYAYSLIPQRQPHTEAGNRGENPWNPQCPKTGDSALESEADSFNKVLEACSKPGVTGKA